MAIIYFLLLVGVFVVQQSVTRECNPEHELPCLDGSCIDRSMWCDDELDCLDGSDENFCSGGKCPKEHFKCRNGKCIPIVAECNGYDNCGDRSDEECEGASWGNKTNDYRKSDKEAVVEAATYLLSMRKSDYGWDSFTPRALIALSFAENILPIPEKDKTLMKKRLDVEIFLNLKRNGEKQKLVDLAFYINALYALCEDPRNFHGMDLVGVLRSETDLAMKSDFNLPVVLLTLCLAEESKAHDFQKLDSMYRNGRNDKIGFKALTIMAMYCHQSAFHQHWPQFEVIMTDFRLRSKLDEEIDVYSAAFTHQAFNAVRFDTSQHLQYLLQRQLRDGSFGDLLATYSVMPALVNSSLLSLKCKSRRYERMPVGQLLSKKNFETKVQYSILIDNKDVVSRTLLLTVSGNKTFYDVMRLAEERDPMYRFMYDETPIGKKLYSLGGIPNDAETGMLWTLYRGQARDVTLTSKRGLTEVPFGIDRVFPRPTFGEHYVYWMERKLN